MSERVVKVKLSAQVAEYEQGMLKAAKATRDVGTEAEKLQQKREAFNTLGSAAVVAGTSMLLLSTLSAKAAIDWESAWTGVTKTVEGTPEQLAEVEEGLRGLTSVLPASHEEIAAVAEAAGQLGIQTQNVVGFTKTMIDLGETTNLSANDAATALARFVNIMGTSQTEVSNLGSALVGLGNNYATTESEILEMSMRLAGAGKQIGLTEGEVLGLATSLSSVGIEAEAGGSAMSKVMIDIAASVEEGGDKLAKFAAAAGMSADEFAQQWRTDPAAALASFVKGLADAESQGQSTLGILADLGITEVRMRDALLRSSAAADDFAAAMAMGTEEFEKNNALAEEAAKRYETVEAQLAIAGNAVRDAAISFGQVFLPAIAEAAGGVQEFAAFMADLPEPVIAIISIAGTAAGAVATLGGMALLAVPKIADFKVALQELGITAGGTWSTLGKAAKVGAGVAAGLAVGVAGADLLTQALSSMGDAAEVTTNKVTTAADAAELMSAALSKGFGATDDIDRANQAIEGLAEMLELTKSGAQASAGELQEVAFAAVAVEKLQTELADLAQNDLPAAQEKFRMVAEAASLNEEQVLLLIDQMEPYKAILTDVASEQQISADAQGLMNLAMGEAVDPAAQAEEALAALEEEAAAAEEALSGTAEALGNVAANAMSMSEAKDSALSAINALTEAAKVEGAELSGTNDASIRLRDTIRDVETAHRDSAEAIINNGGTLEEARAEWEKGREAVINMIAAKTGDREEAIRWADQQLGSASSVESAIDEVYRAWLNLPENKETKYRVEAEEAMRKLQNLKDRLASIPAYRKITLETFQYGSHFTNVNPGSENGDMFAWKAFANGGITTNLDSGIYPGGAEVHKFAEKSLPWEAYISPKADQRDRNFGIWKEAGARLGFLGKDDGARRGPTFKFGDIYGADEQEIIAEIEKRWRRSLATANIEGVGD